MCHTQKQLITDQKRITSYYKAREQFFHPAYLEVLICRRQTKECSLVKHKKIVTQIKEIHWYEFKIYEFKIIDQDSYTSI